MPLLESGYKAAAKRNWNGIFGNWKPGQGGTDPNGFAESASGVQSNITFAQRLNLISEQQAAEMKKTGGDSGCPKQLHAE